MEVCPFVGDIFQQSIRRTTTFICEKRSEEFTVTIDPVIYPTKGDSAAACLAQIYCSVILADSDTPFRFSAHCRRCNYYLDFKPK